MTGSGDVKALFDRQARAWSQHYEPGGDMAERPSRFAAALSARVPAGAAILDFGCGTGEIGSQLSSMGYLVVGADLSDAMLDEARRRGSLVREWHVLPKSGDLPFPPAAFDAVVASSVFEYVPAPANTLTELGRILRPGGLLLITVPDLRHPSRRREMVLRMIASMPAVGALVAGTRWQDGLSYLRLSRNRFKLKQWVSMLQSAGFEPEGIHAVQGPLLLLTARKRMESE